MDSAMSPNGDPVFSAVRSAWPCLSPAMQQAILGTILAAVDQQTALAKPRRRHRRFDDREIERLRAKLASEIVASPTAPNRVLSGRLGLAVSSYKYLRLHHFARQVLQRMSVEPRSAVEGYGGACAAGKTDGPDD